MFEKLDFLKIEYEKNKSLSSVTTMKVGGNAKVIALPDSIEKLKGLIDYLEKNSAKYYVMGNGSDLVFSDTGYDGVVIKTTALNDIELQGNDIKAGAGVKLFALSQFALKNGLSGAEFANGIPATLGGAICMNAGAYGGEMSQIIKTTTYLESGIIKELDAAEHDFGYRHSFFSCGGKVILSAVVSLQKGNTAQIKQKMEKMAAARKEKQPLEYPSSGSAFLRPEGGYAGALIEQCGLKGYTIGKAMVSTKHAGFIINAGGAKSSEIKELVSHIKKVVLEKTGVLLKEEIKFVD